MVTSCRENANAATSNFSSDLALGHIDSGLYLAGFLEQLQVLSSYLSNSDMVCRSQNTPCASFTVRLGQCLLAA